MKRLKLKKSITIATVALSMSLASGFAAATSAEALAKVPADAVNVPNPVEADEDAIKKVFKKSYKKKCKKCHGSKGNGKGPGAKGMEPPPPDWTAGTPATDGQLYWLIMNGSEGTEMKGWKAGLAKPGKEVSEEEAWIMVHIIRGFEK